MRLSLLLALFLVSACTDPDGACASSDECGDGLCTDGRCVGETDGTVGGGHRLDGEVEIDHAGDAAVLTPDAARGDCDGPDADDDGVGDACDNCPNVANNGQADDDRDGLGNACDDTDDTDDPDDPPPDRDEGDGIEWVRIEGGTFDMGGPNGTEAPIHAVDVPTFEIARTEVTVGQYRACVDAGTCTPPSSMHIREDSAWALGLADHPVHHIDHPQAVLFALWSGGRLPTEAEWEYAARSGGLEKTYPWGEAGPTCQFAAMNRDRHCDAPQGATLPVCSKPEGNTVHGLCDMAGNIAEWVQDSFCSYRHTPVDGSAAECRLPLPVNVHRGGSYRSPHDELRTSARDFDFPIASFIESYDDIGFRVARTVQR